MSGFVGSAISSREDLVAQFTRSPHYFVDKFPRATKDLTSSTPELTVRNDSEFILVEVKSNPARTYAIPHPNFLKGRFVTPEVFKLRETTLKEFFECRGQAKVGKSFKLVQPALLYEIYTGTFELRRAGILEF